MFCGCPRLVRTFYYAEGELWKDIQTGFLGRAVLDDLMRYGDRDKGPDTAILTLLFLIFCLLFISNSDALETSQTQVQVATSEVIPDPALGAFRFACCILVIVTLGKGLGQSPYASEQVEVFRQTCDRVSGVMLQAE